MQALAELWEEQRFAQTFDLVHYEGNLLYVVTADAAGTTVFASFYLLSVAINSGLRLASERARSVSWRRPN